MMVKRHTRPNPAKQIKGGIAERESPIAVSNVMIVCPAAASRPGSAHHVEKVAGGKIAARRGCAASAAQTLDKEVRIAWQHD